MMALLLILYVVYSILRGASTLVDASENKKYERYWEIPSYRPKDFYERTEMNWFGCILVWLMTIILNPIYVAGMYLSKPIYWLCHVGRIKNESNNG